MSTILSTKILEALGTQQAVLSVAGYSLPVRFRVWGLTVECSVPVWSGVSELLEKTKEVTLVFLKNSESSLSWIFLRGTGNILKNNKNWENLIPSERCLVDPGDLYQLLQIYPQRMELYDEHQGWGYRETADFTVPTWEDPNKK